MVGADAVVVYYTPNQRDKFHADDYYMSAKSEVTLQITFMPKRKHYLSSTPIIYPAFIFFMELMFDKI